MSALLPSHFKCVAEQFESLWNVVLSSGLDPLLHKDENLPLHSSKRNQIIRAVQKICSLHNDQYQVSVYCQQLLYQRVKSHTVNFYKNLLVPKLKKYGATIQLLENVHEEWHYCKKTLSKYIAKYLIELDRTYVRRLTRDLDNQGHDLKEIVREQFKLCVYGNLSDLIHEAGFASISEFGEIKDESCLRTSLSLISCLGDQHDDFTKNEWDRPVEEMLSATMRQIADGWTHCSLQSFLAKAHNQINTYGSICIHDDSKDVLVRTFCEAISETRTKLFFSGDELITLLDEEQYHEWQKIFCCFGKDHGFINSLSEFLEEYIQRALFQSKRAKLAKPLEDDQIFRRMLGIWQNVDNIIQDGLNNKEEHEFIIQTIQRPFLSVVQTPLKNINLDLQIAEHFHSILSRDGETRQALQASRVEELQHMISLTKLLMSEGAVEFISFYRDRLVKRLIDGKLDSYQMELHVIQEFLKDFEQEDVISLQSLLHDASKWQKYQWDISLWASKHSKNHSSFMSKPRVVRSLPWNLPDDELKLPEELQRANDFYDEFFRSQHSSKKFFLHSCVGRVVIKTKLWKVVPFMAIRVSLTTGQMCVLSLFEEQDQLSVNDIIEELLSKEVEQSGGVRDLEDSKKTIFSLLRSMMGRSEILVKNPVSRNFEDDHVIVINKNFMPSEVFVELPSPDPSYGDDDIVSNTEAGIQKQSSEMLA